MTEQEFRAVYPLIIGWIQNTLAQHAPAARAVSELGFKRLPQFYQASTLATAKVVVVPKVPAPLLTKLGLTRFIEFESMDMDGVTYLDTYFVRTDHADRESLHFHELVHVIQWRLLGPERFLALYADGLERFGYRHSPLEEMAYGFQDAFDHGAQPFDVEAACRAQLGTLAAG